MNPISADLMAVTLKAICCPLGEHRLTCDYSVCLLWSYCCNSQDTLQGLRQVILAVVTCVRTCEGPLVFSSRFHTSMLPSSFPMKKTAGRDKDQHPTVHCCSEPGGCMMGPSWTRGQTESMHLKCNQSGEVTVSSYASLHTEIIFKV